MKTHLSILFGSLLLSIILLIPVHAQVKTDDELRQENERLKARIKLLEENNQLKEKVKTLESGQTLPGASSSVTPTSTPTPSPTATPTSPTGGNTGAGANNQTSNSVCLAQDVNSANFSILDKAICDLAEAMVIDVQDRTRDEVQNNPANPEPQQINFRPATASSDLALISLGRLAQTQTTTLNLSQEVRDFLLEAENKRNDKQIGSDSRAAGTTSLAVKGGIPQFLGWAIENGAAVGTRSGNTLTFRVNPIGLIQSLSDVRPFGNSLSSDLPSFFKSGSTFDDAARKFSLGFSFDITRGTDPPTFIGSKQQLSAVSARYNFLNRKDPRHSRYQKDWEKLKTEYLDPLAQFQNRLFLKLVCNPVTNTSCTSGTYVNTDLENWRKETEAKLKTIVFPVNDILFEAKKIELIEKVRQILADQLAVLPTDKLVKDVEFVSALRENGEILLKYRNAKQELLDKIAKGEVFTVEYTNYREVNAPEVSNFRLILEKGFSTNWNVTANASLSFFNKKPTGDEIKRIRDFDFTLQLEKPLLDLPFGRPIFSFSGQYQRLMSDITDAAGVVIPNSKGDIAVGQFKLTIPINGTGIKLPISMTFANRTELIKESTVRGNFGFTFDLDRLLFGRSLF